MSGLAQ